ncbi:unnamed protein product [Rotaria socialis]|uniref:Uncharacterized protein n=1 Tax=Rotaria socialis TaxID=392032 RepID=A0A818VJL3_9BILA|nr:unnamed protein product [Rotaria socialis]
MGANYTQSRKALEKRDAQTEKTKTNQWGSLFSRHGHRVTSLLQILIELYLCLRLKYELIRSFLYLSDLFTSSQQLYDLCYKYFCTWFDEDDVMISLVSYGLCKPNILFRQRTKEYNELYIRLIERSLNTSFSFKYRTLMKNNPF